MGSRARDRSRRPTSMFEPHVARSPPKSVTTMSLPVRGPRRGCVPQHTKKCTVLLSGEVVGIGSTRDASWGYRTLAATACARSSPLDRASGASRLRKRGPAHLSTCQGGRGAPSYLLAQNHASFFSY